MIDHLIQNIKREYISTDCDVDNKYYSITTHQYLLLNSDTVKIIFYYKNYNAAKDEICVICKKIIHAYIRNDGTFMMYIDESYLV